MKRSTQDRRAPIKVENRRIRYLYDETAFLEYKVMRPADEQPFLERAALKFMEIQEANGGIDVEAVVVESVNQTLGDHPMPELTEKAKQVMRNKRRGVETVTSDTSEVEQPAKRKPGRPRKNK